MTTKQTLIETAPADVACSQPKRNATYAACPEHAVCGVDMGDGRTFWYCAGHAPQMWKAQHAPEPAVDSTTIAPKRPRKGPAPDLPRIIRFVSKTDAGEYGNATCPHCGADGRYVWSFDCADGTRRGAMAGCIRLFPVSKVAEEGRKIMERKADRERKGQNLASWDVAKIEAIDAFAAGSISEGDCLRVIASENDRRSQWMARKGGRR